MTIDLDKLLAPIAEDASTGMNLRDAADDATFVTIDDLRREVDAAFDPGGGKVANWPAVLRACEQALNTRSKDLQLAVWLTEALAHIEGFAGLHVGLQLTRALLDRYWDTVHPGAGEGAIEPGARGRWLSWLSSQKGFLPSIRAIRLVGEGPSREEWIPWDAFLEAQRLEETAASNQARYQEMIEGGAFTRERWNKAVSVTKPAQLRAELEALRACENEVLALDRLCEARFGSDDAPSFVELRGLLSEIREFLVGRVGSDATTTDGAVTAAGPGGSRAAVVSLSGPIGSRQDALRRLGEVAAFFRLTEPHSPLPHLIDRAVRWAGMSFEELLLDVMSKDALKPVWDTLGIEPPPPDEGA